MASLYVTLLEEINEDTPIEARLEIYYGLCRLGWSQRRAYKVTGIEECTERILKARETAKRASCTNGHYPALCRPTSIKSSRVWANTRPLGNKPATH